MKYESIAQMHQKRNEDRAKGLKRGPLHTLQECCEEAGITPVWFGRYAAQHSDAPQPVLQSSQTPGKAKKIYYRKHEFVQWVNQIRQQKEKPMRSVDRQVIPPDVLEQRLFGMTMPEINRQKQMLSAGAIEARNNLEKARLLFEAQQKEKAMPDIKTALQQALAKTATDWAADDEAHSKIEPQQEKAMTAATETTDTPTDKRVTTNVSRATFYFIRDNAGLTAQEVTTQLMAQGYKATSVTSLIGQMLRTRMLMEADNGGLTATIKEYIPIQSKPGKTSKPAPRKPAAPVQQRKQVTLVNTRTGEVFNPKPAPVATPAEWTVDSVIGSLSVRQALAVYMELKQIFGE